MLSVGVDMGGSFTDGYFVEEDRVVTRKVPTLRFDLTRSLVQCLRAGAQALGFGFGEFLGRITVLRVATTVSTNAVIEGAGSRVGLLVASGEETRLYAERAPEALFRRFLDPALVRGIAGPVDAAGLLQSCRELNGRGVRQVVVSLPHGREGSDQEREVRRMVRDHYPEHYLRSVPLQLASDLTACRDDHVRTATATVNAYLHRDIAQLLYRTEQELRAEGLRSMPLMVHANAGAARVGKSTAIGMYGSGPSAGLSGAEAVAARYGDRVVVTADMGGTTLDLGLLVDGRSQTETRPEIAGVRVALLRNRTESIGCGGGSVARVEEGRVRLGPESAGAIPGPAAFNRGGERATLTDAAVVLGLLAAGKELGGHFVLALEPAQQAIARDVATPVGCDVTTAADLVNAAAAAHVAEALGRLIRECGRDPAEVVLYAFGGAGPVHLWGAARLAGIRRVRSFPFGSVFSAFGCTMIDVRHRYEVGWDGSTPIRSDLERTLERLLRRARGDIRAEGFSLDDVRVSVILTSEDGGTVARSAVVHGISASSTATALADVTLDAGRSWMPVEIVALDVTVVIPRPLAPPTAGQAWDGAVAGVRRVWWDGVEIPTPVLRWEEVASGRAISGPVLVEERDSTHAVGPGWTFRIDAYGHGEWTA